LEKIKRKLGQAGTTLNKETDLLAIHGRDVYELERMTLKKAMQGLPDQSATRPNEVGTTGQVEFHDRVMRTWSFKAGRALNQDTFLTDVGK